MCTACHEPLAVAQSLEADSERAYIRGLIAQGQTKSQILKNSSASTDRPFSANRRPTASTSPST